MVRGSKVLKIVIDGNGSYLGMQKGCFVVKDKREEVRRIPLFENEIGEIIVSSGNFVSTGVLACCGFWDIPVMVLSRNGRPVAVLRGLDDDSHVETRIAQYEALKNGKSIQIAKQIVYSKIESQNIVLRKYGLKQHDLARVKAKIENIESDNLKNVRKKLLPIEGKASDFYFKQIFQLLPKNLQVEKRKGWKAYDGINNTFNLAYTFLKYRVYLAILRAKLEPYLGFVHSEQFGKPSLVCDFMELYRYLIDFFIIEYSQALKPRDFTLKTEWYSTNRMGKRQVLNKEKTKELTRKLNEYFETRINIPRIRHGKHQTLETLINEEAYLLAKFLRNEKFSWKPRVANL